MAAARGHEIDCVLVWKFDRFSCTTSHLLAASKEFNHLGVRLVSVQDQIDTDSPIGRAIFTIIGAMAELESSLQIDELGMDRPSLVPDRAPEKQHDRRQDEGLFMVANGGP